MSEQSFEPTEIEDVEGHRIRAVAEDVEDDVEGHRIRTVQPPRDLDIER